MDLDFKEEKDKIETSCIYTTGATGANHMCFCSFDIEAYTDIFTYIRNGTDIYCQIKKWPYRVPIVQSKKWNLTKFHSLLVLKNVQIYYYEGDLC